MKKALTLLSLLLGSCASDPLGTQPAKYAEHANQTYLAESINKGPKNEKEREIAEKVDALFADTPGDRPYKEDIGKHISLPKLLHSEPPVYPSIAAHLGIIATVVVAFRIDKDGSILETKVLSSTDNRFNAAALSAIRKWKFTGGLTEGQPDIFPMVVPIGFTH